MNNKNFYESVLWALASSLCVRYYTDSIYASLATYCALMCIIGATATSGKDHSDN